MDKNAYIILKNQHKWKTLPAGRGRQKVELLLSLGNDELTQFYDNCIDFWKKERGWEYDKYSITFCGRSILEIGSGLGYDGITYSKYVKKWTFCDIIAENIELLKRVTHLLKTENADFQVIKDIINHDYVGLYDGLYAHGVLHHVPFEIAKKQVANIDRYLKPGAKVVLLMYPFERWKLCGKPPFEKFGSMTDGEGTPWAEYYDEQKIMALFGSCYELKNEIKWGKGNSEFVNFELEKL